MALTLTTEGMTAPDIAPQAPPELAIDPNDVFGMEPPDFRDDHEKAMDTWRQESAVALDAAVRDPKSYADERIPHGYTADEWRKTRIVDDWMRLHTDGQDPPMGPLREFERARLAQQAFAGAGADSDESLFAEITRKAQSRKDARDRMTEVRQRAIVDVFTSESKMTDGKLTRGELDWPQLKAELASKPGYDPDREPEMMAAFYDTRAEAKEKLNAYKAPLDMLWGAMQAGKSPDEFGRVAYDTAAAIPKDQQSEFLEAVALRAQTLPKEQQASFWANFSKATSRGISSFRQGAAEEITGSVYRGGTIGWEDFLGSNEAVAARKRSDAKTLQDFRLDREFVRKVQDINNGVYDPIQYLSEKDSGKRIMEEIGYQVVPVTVNSLTMAMPYVGLPAMFAAMKGGAHNTLMSRFTAAGMEQDAALDAAETWSVPMALVETALEKAQYGIWSRSMPGFTKALDGIGDQIANRALRMGAKTLAIGAAETAVEVAQDTSSWMIQDLAAGLDEDLPDVQWTGEGGAFDGFWANTAVIFGTMLPLSILGAAGGLSQESRNAAFRRADPLERLALGMTPEASAAIDNAAGPSSLSRAIDNAWEGRDPNSPEALAAVEKLKTRVEQTRRASTLLEEIGYSMPAITAMPDGSFIVRDNLTGEEVGRATTTAELDTVVRGHTVAMESMQEDEMRQLATWLGAAKIAAKDSGIAQELNLSRRFGMQDVEEMGPAAVERFMAEVALQEQAEGGDGSATRAVFGYNLTETRDGVKQMTNRIFQGANIGTLFHENWHGARKQAKAAGNLTREDDIRFLRAFDAVLKGRQTREVKAEDGSTLAPSTRESFLPEGMADADISETHLDEAIAEVAEVLTFLFSRNHTTNKHGLTRKLVSTYLGTVGRLAPEATRKFSGFIRAIRAKMGLAMSRAYHVKKAIAKGELDPAEIDTYMGKLFGTDEQAEHDDGVQAELGRIFNQEENVEDDNIPFSIGRAANESWRVKDEAANTDLKQIQEQWGQEGVEAFASASRGEITLSKIKVPKDAQGQGTGTAKMKELLSIAQRHGMRVVLSPSKDFGASSIKRLESFYGSLGFQKNAGANKDFTTRETMIWNPDETKFSIGRVAERPLYSATNVQDLRHDKTAWLESDASPSGADEIVSKFYKTAAFAGVPRDAVLVAMPSTSGRNTLPMALARRIAKDFGQVIEGRPAGFATAKGEAKNKRTFFDKESDPVGFEPNAAVIADLQGKPVFITEDVHNTGESWIAFARMLQENNVDVRGVATLVSTEQRMTSPRDMERMSQKMSVLLGKDIDEVKAAVHSLFDGTFKQLFNKAEAEISRANERSNAANAGKLFDIASSGRRAGAYSNPFRSGDEGGGSLLGGNGQEQSTFQFSIGGIKAARWDEYQSQGRAFTGADGKPRFEMDSSQAAFNPSAIKDPAHRNGFKRLGADSPIRWLVQEGVDTPLGNLISFDELFENYPQLAGLMVRLKTSDPASRGTFTLVEINGKAAMEFSTITLSDRLDAGTALNVLLHEVQHAVQNIEGFARGSSPERVQRQYDTLVARYSGISSSEEMDEVNKASEEIFNRFDRDELTAEEMDQAIQELIAKNPAWQELKKVAEELQSLGTGGIGFNAHEAYRQVPGEKEARGVQARQSMTAEQRAATPFMDQWASFSIGRAEVAERMQGGALNLVRDPVRRVQAMSRIARDFGELALRFGRIEALSGRRMSKGQLKQEANAREDMAADEKIGAVWGRYGSLLADDDLTRIKSQPVHAYLSVKRGDGSPDPLHGRIMSKAQAMKRYPERYALHRGGEYDGADNISRSIYGGQLMPDQAAQELFDAGLISEPYTDAMWEALEREQNSVIKNKEALAKALEEIREAKREAKREANEWLATQSKDQETTYNPKEEILASLRMLDAIILALPPEVRGHIGGYTQMAQIGSDEARLAFLKDKLKKADKALETFLRESFNAEWLDLLKRAKPDKDNPGQRPIGQIDADALDILRAAESAMWMSFSQGEAEADRLDALAEHEDTKPEDADKLRATAQMVRLTTNWSTGDAARREQAVIEGTRIYYGGLMALRVKNSARAERLRGLQSSAKQGTGQAGDRMDRKKMQRKEKAGRAGQAGRLVWEFLSFGQLTNVLFGESSAVAKWFNAKEIAASNAYEDGVQAKAEAIESMFESLSGSRFNGEKLRHRMQTKEVIQTTDAHGKEHTFTEAEGVSFLLMWRQEDGKRHMEGQIDDEGNLVSEWGWTEQAANDIESQLTPEAKAMMAFLGTSYGEEYGRINDVFRRIWNVSMPRHKFYAPLTVKPSMGKQDAIVDPVSGDSMGVGLTPGSLKNRSQTAVTEPDFRDAFQVFLTHARQMEHFISYAEFARDAMAVVNRREIRNSIEAVSPTAATALGKWVDYFALGGLREAAAGGAWQQFFAGALSRLSSAALVGRISVLGMQTLQLGAAAYKMPLGAYLSRFARLMGGRLAWGDAIKSDYIQRRMLEMPPVVRDAVMGLAAGTPNRAKYLATKAARSIAGADGLFTAGTYAILYDYHLTQARKAGIPNPENHAHAEAERLTDQVAQPMRTGARSWLEISMQNQPAFRALWNFSTDPRQKISLIIYEALRHDVSGKDKAAAVAKAAAISWAVSGILQAVLRSVFRDLRSDDDDELFDERHWDLKRLGLMALSGPFGGFPYFGKMIEDSIYNAAGEWKPVSNLIDAVSASVPAAGRLVMLDSDDVLKDIEKVLNGAAFFSGTSAAGTSAMHAVRDAVNIYENFDGND